MLRLGLFVPSCLLMVAPVFSQELAPVSELDSALLLNTVDSGASDEGIAETQVGVIRDTATSVPEETFSALQLLRTEVQQLRGMVETLEFRLQQVKQQQLDDYLDLDRRVSGGESSSQRVTPVETSPITTSQTANSSYLPSSNNADVDASKVKESYDKASSMLLKDRDMEGAVIAFKAHIEEFPKSPYVANASYWLGEIFLLQGLEEQARLEFSRIVDEHVGHRKEMDARFKLGKIYHQRGEMARARALLESVGNSAGPVASKATKYLQANF